MQPQVTSIRSFIGSKNYNVSREFYKKMGFEERVISSDMSLFSMGSFSFYLQDAYVKDWINNSMLFLEVMDLDAYRNFLISENITQTKGVRLSEIHIKEWGREFFLHDPSGVLWHIGNFKSL